MTSPRRRQILATLVAATLLAACGGSGDSEGDADSDVPTADNGDDAVSDDSSDPSAEAASDDSSGDDGAVPPTATGDELDVVLSFPTSGGLGESIQLSPDGTRLAHMTGGLQGDIVIYDLSTGSEIARGVDPGQGPIAWANDDQLVSWNPGPLNETDLTINVVDAASAMAGEPEPAQYPDGYVDCSLPFSFDATAANGAVFASLESSDPGTQICRLDVATRTVTGVVAPTTGALPFLLLSGDGTELAVIDSGTTAGGAATAYTFDAATLAPRDTIELAASRVSYVGEQLVAFDGASPSQSADGSTTFAVGIQFGTGPYGVGGLEGNSVVVGADGQVIGVAAPGFPSQAVGSADGSVVAVRTTEAIVVVRPG